MKNLEILIIFARVADMKSFTLAAESLGIQKGRVSMVVRELEREVGATLLHRTTRTVQLTEDGRAFYSRALDLLSAAEELKSMFSLEGMSLRGRIRVDMPAVLAQSVVIPALPELMEAHPELELELSSTDRRVDLVQEGFDCVVRLGPIVDETLIARPLGHLRMINAASPRYLERFGVPQTIDDLINQRHRMVHYTRNFGSKPDGWAYPTEDGLGLIQGGYSSLLPHIKRGALVEVLPDLPPEPLAAFFVVAHRRNLSQRVRAFMSWTEEILKPYFD
jgi:DNA-binding transcriptional LysR family regulator